MSLHEDIRYKVISKLRDSILEVIDSIRTSMPRIYLTLKQQLDEYERVIKERKDIPLIIKNEKIIEGVGRPDIEVFGGRIIIEVKGKTSEFPVGFEQLSRYIEASPYTEYAILTNFDQWEYYKVEDGKLIQLKDVSLFDIVKEVLLKGVKVLLSTENVKNMFHPLVLFEDELLNIFEKYKIRDSALFEAYRNIIKRLYEKASEEDIERLFMKHTLMQVIVSSCLTISLGKRTTPRRACSGADIEAEIVLPYLNWWESLRNLEESDRVFLDSLLESIYARTLLLDWKSGSKEDVFRELYEVLIDAETRRKIGEYYTPLWLVEYMVNKVSDDLEGLRDKIILDPFCGSGTFLVIAFYKKVQEGEDANKAIREIIGFDINPLAVSIARAELMIAYQSLKKEIATPLIFNTDSTTLLLHEPGKWESVSFLDELIKLENKIKYVEHPLSLLEFNTIDFSEILKIETILRQYFKEISLSEDIKQELKVKMDKLQSVEWKSAIISHIVNILAEEESIDAITKLIEKYGNGVWAVSITSLFTPHIIQKMKVDIVITNPPWAQLTEPKGSYGKLLRSRAKELLKGYDKTGQIITGSDISSILLYGGISIARDEVAYVMPEEVVYTPGSSHGVGRILTYSVVRDYDGEAIEVGFDAFQHGRLPAVIFLRKKDGEVVCYLMEAKWKEEYSKTLRLSEMEYMIKRREFYKDYMKKVILYTQMPSQLIEKELDIEKVVSKGDHIMGLFGGEKKKGAKKYGGLIFEIKGEDKLARQYNIQLSGTKSTVKISDFFLEIYWKRLIYRGRIFPFYLDGVYDVLLSSKGEQDLRDFLKTHIFMNVSNEDKRKIKILIEELTQPDKPKTLESNKYYVIYRRMRSFPSVVLTPSEIELLSDSMKKDLVISDTCSFLSTSSKKKAYYYASLLNYLTYKVMDQKGAFVRDQFLRPLIAILNAGLEWREENWQLRVAELGEKLHKIAPKCFKDFIKMGMKVEKCFKRLKAYDESKELFEKLIKIIDENVSTCSLYESLKHVCKLKETSLKLEKQS